MINKIEQKEYLKLKDLWHIQQLIGKIIIVSLFIFELFLLPIFLLFENDFILGIFVVFGICLYFLLLTFIKKDNSFRIAQLIAGKICCNQNNLLIRYEIIFEDGNRAFYCKDHLINVFEELSKQIISIKKVGRL